VPSAYNTRLVSHIDCPGGGQVWLEGARDFGRYNKVFAEHFKDAMLARTTVEARAVINTKIEMDAIAYKPVRP